MKLIQYLQDNYEEEEIEELFGTDGAIEEIAEEINEELISYAEYLNHTIPKIDQSELESVSYD
jgi:hypothetical protein